ncbi:MAG: hypothetical protein HYU66_01155 [Armatimonadetes bacterium]|nr:hypothetical protein [Armatimonadota bacterium]
MTSRERLLTALHNGRPDRLPCQVHGWMGYYLNRYLNGDDWYQANDRFSMDHAIYVSPSYHYADHAWDNWQVRTTDLGTEDGTHKWVSHITTPKGTLTHGQAANEITCWSTEHPLKTEADFALWEQFYPEPDGIDLTPVRETREKLGDRGILRSHPPSFGQGSPWQSLCTWFGTLPSIYLALDNPAFVHHALDVMCRRTVRALAMWEGTPADMVETGGGAGSNTVISPAMFAEFCVPYDRRQHEALHAVGVKVVYHLCGGLMKQLDYVVDNGADGLETLTPPGMGGDCDLAEASRRAGDKLFFIGGFDQNAGFEHGTPETARALVHQCFEATRDHAGYIVAPSDHFFHGDPACVQAFVDAARECVY